MNGWSKVRQKAQDALKNLNMNGDIYLTNRDYSKSSTKLVQILRIRVQPVRPFKTPPSHVNGITIQSLVQVNHASSHRIIIITSCQHQNTKDAKKIQGKEKSPGGQCSRTSQVPATRDRDRRPNNARRACSFPRQQRGSRRRRRLFF